MFKEMKWWLTAYIYIYIQVQVWGMFSLFTHEANEDIYSF